MMIDYLLRLAILLPLLGLMIWGSLKLTQRLQSRFTGMQRGKGAIRLRETSLLAPGIKLAVIRFHDREILLGCTRSGLVRLAEVNAPQDTAQNSEVAGEPS